MNLSKKEELALENASYREKLEEEEWLNKILYISSYSLQGLKHISNLTMMITKYAAPQTLLLLSNLGSLNYMFEGLIGTSEALSYFYKANELNRFQHAATAWASYQLASSTVLNTASIMSLLSTTGSIHGAVGAISGPLAPLVYSCILWGQAIHSYAEFIHELRKYKDPIYQEKNLNKKLKNINVKIESLQQKLQHLDEKKSKNFNKKITTIKNQIEKLEKEQQAIYQHALLHARFGGIKNNEPNDYIKNYLKKYPKLGPVTYNKTTNNENIYKELRKNQRDKVVEKHINTISFTLAAIGVTLIAISPFIGPAAPALVTAGIAIAAIGGAIKLGYILEKKLSNHLAEKRYCKANNINRHEARKNVLAEVLGVKKESPELDDIMKTMREKDQEKIVSRYYKEKNLNSKKTARQIFSTSSTFFKSTKKEEVEEKITLPKLRKT